MTDKQIIIHNVDVSECKHWKGYCRIASLCDYPGHLCEVTPNCYYKQLKRKEQECETLASQLDFEVQKKECLEQECEKLKQTLAEIKEIMKKHCRKCKKHKSYYFKLCCTCKYADILQKISEVENE